MVSQDVPNVQVGLLRVLQYFQVFYNYYSYIRYGFDVNIRHLYILFGNFQFTFRGTSRELAKAF